MYKTSEWNCCCSMCVVRKVFIHTFFGVWWITFAKYSINSSSTFWWLPFHKPVSSFNKTGFSMFKEQDTSKLYCQRIELFNTDLYYIAWTYVCGHSLSSNGWECWFTRIDLIFMANIHLLCFYLTKFHLEKVSPLKIQATQLNEVLTGVKRVPVVRLPLLMPGAVAPSPVLGLR